MITNKPSQQSSSTRPSQLYVGDHGESSIHQDSISARPVHLPKFNWRTDLPNLLGSSVQDRAVPAESNCNYLRWSCTKQEVFRAAQNS